jgi:3-deoxy-D-manno-octulosonate 8-phosphate phosphatase (KDO 8-P phosphatase)
MTSDAPHLQLIELIRRVRVVGFDFDGVFTDNAVYVFEDGREAVRCSRSDGLGLRRLEAAGVVPVIISTEANPVVTRRSKKLRIRCVQGVDDKVAAFAEVLQEHGVGFDAACFVGNDINDIDCLRRVALPIAVGDAYPELDRIAHYRTRRRGGEGAVREVCDLIAEVKGGSR